MTGIVADLINALIIIGFVMGGFIAGRWYESKLRQIRQQ